jgi:hypothetical protein
MAALVAAIHVLRRGDGKQDVDARHKAGHDGRWNAMYKPIMDSPPANPPRFMLPKMFWIGLAVLVLGTGPLLAVIAAAALGLTRDPDPNPIGFGLLAFVTFWPAAIMMGAALITALDRRKAAKRRSGLR